MTYYQLNTSQLDEKSWDVSTVTTADFTVEVNIPQSLWEKWLVFQKNYKAFNPDIKKDIMNFHTFFQLQVEEQMKKTKRCFASAEVTPLTENGES